MTQRRLVRVLGGLVPVIVRQTPDGYICELDRQRLRGDCHEPVDRCAMADTEAEAVHKYKCRCEESRA